MLFHTLCLLIGEPFLESCELIIKNLQCQSVHDLLIRDPPNADAQSQTSVTPKCVINHHNYLVHNNHSEHKTWINILLLLLFKFLVELHHFHYFYVDDNASFLVLKHLFTFSTNITNRPLQDTCKKKVNILFLQQKSLEKLLTVALALSQYTSCPQISWLS